MFGNEIAKVVNSVTHQPIIVQLGEVEIEVPRPVAKTTLLVEKQYAQIDDIADDASISERVRHTRHVDKLAMAVAIYLTGREDKKLAKRVEESWTVETIIVFLMSVMGESKDIEVFFVFTTSLRSRSLLSPTREVETASGL